VVQSDNADLAVCVLGDTCGNDGDQGDDGGYGFVGAKYFFGLILARLGRNAYQYFPNVCFYKDANAVAEAAAENRDDGEKLVAKVDLHFWW